MLHKVRMFSANGQFLSLISVPKAPFTRPTHMVTLQSGQFVVRDDNKVIVFNSEGKFLRTLWQDKGAVRAPHVFLAPLVVSLQSSSLCRSEETYPLDIIFDKARSKCRLLTYQLNKLYITDLGLDCVYILDPSTISVKVSSTSPFVFQL